MKHFECTLWYLFVLVAVLCLMWCWPPTALLCKFRPPGVTAKVIQDRQGQGRRYAIYVPPCWKDGEELPLIVYLHGESDCGDDGRLQLRNGLASAVWERLQTNDPLSCFVLFPQSVKPWQSDDSSQELVVDILKRTIEEYRVDRERICLTGISSGGIAAWQIARAYPDLWASLVPISCSADEVEVESARYTKIPIRCYQNRFDDIESVRNAVAVINASGGSARLIEFDDHTHNAWTSAYSDVSLYAWIFRQSRTK